MHYDSPLTITLQYNGSIQYMEHIVVKIDTDGGIVNYRGDIEIKLTSPSGTKSTLLSYRDNDTGYHYYYNWPFMSVMFWGENPTGEWNLTFSTRNNRSYVDRVIFQFFGVSSTPESVANIPATCHSDCRRGCAGMGSEYCDACVNLRNAYTLECIDTCPAGYTERNGYCYNQTLPTDECFSPLKEKEEGKSFYLHWSCCVIDVHAGSCVDAGFVGCCVEDDCEVFAPSYPISCFCDEDCFLYNDCCDDITNTGCVETNGKIY